MNSEMANNAQRGAGDAIPTAAIQPSSLVTARRWRTRLWWLTGICLVIAMGLVVSSMRAPGEKIVIHFGDGFGIKPGDTLRYRGIDVGAVTAAQLTSDMQGIDVQVQLTPGHSAIAVEGSRFWIERPRLRIGQVSGLETVIGAKFIGTIPGAAGGPAQREFVGLESPLGMAEQESIDIRVRFPAGEGLSTGDPARYLGIDVGEVTYVELNDQLESVWVGVRLVGSAKQLARSGTQFWVERPRLELTEIRGLETIVGGRYLALEPSHGSETTVQEFVGLPEAPPLIRREGSMELELEARSRMGLVRRAPITYRGLEVGRVADVSLASDGASVTVQIIIEPEYVDLVRQNSVWWSTGGMRFDASLTGVNFTVDSFTSWLRGGISFATPDPPGDKVVTGYRFGLAEKADADWLEWKPRIATGPWAAQGSDRIPLPRVVRIAASWKSSFLGIGRRKSVEAWCLPLSDDRACVPTTFVTAAAAAKTAVTLEIAGSSQEIDPGQIADSGGIAFLPLPKDAKVVRWPTDKIAKEAWSGKTALLIVNPELSEPLPLDASRAAYTSGGVIEINEAVPIHKTMEGSPVVEATSGELLGLLTTLKERWIVVIVKP